MAREGTGVGTLVAAVAAGTDIPIGNELKSHTARGSVEIPWGREGTEQLTH